MYDEFMFYKNRKEPVIFVDEDKRIVSWNKSGLGVLTDHIQRAKRKVDYDSSDPFKNFDYNGVRCIPVYDGEIFGRRTLENAVIGEITKVSVTLNHEINNALMVIQGLAQLNLFKENDPVKVEDYEKILTSAKGIGDVLHALEKSIDNGSIKTTNYVDKTKMWDKGC